MEKHYSVGEFANLVGKSVKTLQRWDRNGVLVAHRDIMNNRYYIESDLRKCGINLVQKLNEKDMIIDTPVKLGLTMSDEAIDSIIASIMCDEIIKNSDVRLMVKRCLCNLLIKLGYDENWVVNHFALRFE